VKKESYQRLKIQKETLRERLRKETLRHLLPAELAHAWIAGGCASGGTDVSNACCDPCCETITCGPTRTCPP